MKLGDIVSKYRAEHDLSQRQFAIMCGLSNGTISNIEKGINPNTGKPLTPSLDLVRKLASTMGLTLTELLEMADDMPIALVEDEPCSVSGSALYGGNTNIIRLAGRDGTLRERQLTDEEMRIFSAMLDALPDASEDL